MMGDDGFSERQKAFARFMALNKLEFKDVERLTGVGYSTLKAYATNAGQAMTDRTRTRILSGFRARDEDVFVRPAILDPTQIGEQPDFPPEPETLPTSEPVDGTVRIPAYDIKLAAGGGYYVDAPQQPAPWILPKSFITGELGLNPETLSVVEVIGVSMQPLLQPRDRVLIDHSDTNPSPPGVFAIWDGSGLLVKNVQRVSGAQDRVRLTSDNPKYEPLEFFIDDITIVGRVVWFSRRI